MNTPLTGHMDITQFYLFIAAALAFFEILFVHNMRKPKKSE